MLFLYYQKVFLAQKGLDKQFATWSIPKKPREKSQNLKINLGCWECFQIGTYKGAVVAIKKVKLEKIVLSRDDLLELNGVSFKAWPHRARFAATQILRW